MNNGFGFGDRYNQRPFRFGPRYRFRAWDRNKTVTFSERVPENRNRYRDRNKTQIKMFFGWGPLLLKTEIKTFI